MNKILTLGLLGLLGGCDSNTAGAQDELADSEVGRTQADGGVAGNLDGSPLADAAGPDAAGPDAAGPDAAAPDASGPNPDATVDEGGSIAIYLTGDYTERLFEDELSGQTPRAFAMGLSKYYIMTSADDPSPVLCFDHDTETVVAPLEADTQVGACRTANVPTATYTHGRVKIDWSRFTVAGTVHQGGRTFPGDLTVWRAYSDTTYAGERYTAGAGLIDFSGLVQTPVRFGPPPPVPGVTLELTDGELWMTFPFSRPLPIVRGDQSSHWARFHWQIYEGFRWEDADEDGYEEGVWDVGLSIDDTEQVRLIGVAGYYITSSID